MPGEQCAHCLELLAADEYYGVEQRFTRVADFGFSKTQEETFEKVHPLDDWLARTGCDGDDAERVKALLADRMTDDGEAWTDTKVVLKARKSQS